MSDPQKRMQLPRLVDPRKLAHQGARLQGEIPTVSMDRLRAAVVDQEAAASANVAFRRDEVNRCIVEGHVVLRVAMQCQRCLGNVDVPLESELLFGVVWSDDRAAVLPKWLDPWLVEGEEANLYKLVEDELLLSLPIVAFHDEAQCRGNGHYSTGEVETNGENPFSILAKLKK